MAGCQGKQIEIESWCYVTDYARVHTRGISVVQIRFDDKAPEMGELEKSDEGTKGCPTVLRTAFRCVSRLDVVGHNITPAAEMQPQAVMNSEY